MNTIDNQNKFTCDICGTLYIYKLNNERCIHCADHIANFTLSIKRILPEKSWDKAIAAVIRAIRSYRSS